MIVYKIQFQMYTISLATVFQILHDHHQPINIPTAGALAFLYGLYIRRTGHNPPRETSRG
jgi:hypothetical protein